jgi:hypothetical protein
MWVRNSIHQSKNACWPHKIRMILSMIIWLPTEATLLFVNFLLFDCCVCSCLLCYCHGCCRLLLIWNSIAWDGKRRLLACHYESPWLPCALLNGHLTSSQNVNYRHLVVHEWAGLLERPAQGQTA